MVEALLVGSSSIDINIIPKKKRTCPTFEKTLETLYLPSPRFCER